MIERLLKMKGRERLEVDDDMVERVIRYPYSQDLKLFFLETKLKDWSEYYILMGTRKTDDGWNDTVTMLDSVSKWMNSFEDCKEIGIQELDTTRDGYNYILIYIIGDDNK